MSSRDKVNSRKRRHFRIRQGIIGTKNRPRLNVFKSRVHIYAQLIDDNQGRTLVSASTLDPAVRKTIKSTGTMDGARAVGKLLAERAKEVKVNTVVFDRGGWAYHGRIQALAEASREAGLKF